MDTDFFTSPVTLGIALGVIIIAAYIIYKVDATRKEKKKALYRTLSNRYSLFSSERVINAMQTVAQKRDQEAIAYLKLWLDHPNKKLASNAVQALRAIGWKPKDADEALSCDLILQNYDAVVARGEAAIQPLAQALKKGEQVAARLLGEIGTPKATQALIDALQFPSREARQAAANTLVTVYQSHGLSQPARQQILAQQAAITAPHTDRSTVHTDHGSGRASHVDGAGSYSDCNDGAHADYMSGGHTDTPGAHDDRGIGVNFPI